MKEPAYKLVRLTGMSAISMEDALAEVIQRAYITIKNLCWLQVGEPRSEVRQ